MTAQEFSDQFDVLYNNITSNQAPGLDEYEKSVFLTKAQEEILLSYFDPKLNKSAAGFDMSQKRQVDFSAIIRSETISSSSMGDATVSTHSNSKSFSFDSLSNTVLAVINEFVSLTRGSYSISVPAVPINYLEFTRLMSKPFKRPLQYQAWRVITGTSSVGNKCDLVVGPSDTITGYTIRYIKKPQAIITNDLDSTTTIDGSYAQQDCELDEALHSEILQRAVELAKASYTGDINSIVGLGTNSQTNIGYVGGAGNS